MTLSDIICFVISVSSNPEDIEKQKEYWLNYIKKEFGNFNFKPSISKIQF
jgi:hypothetical protein